MPIFRFTHPALLAALVAGLFAGGGVALYRSFQAETARPAPGPLAAAVQATTPTAVSGLAACKPDDITLSLRVEPWFGDNLITVESANNGPPCASRILTVSTRAATGLSGPNIWYPGWDMPTGQQDSVQLIWQSDCVSAGKAFEVRAELAGREAALASFPAGGCSHGNSASVFPAGKLDGVNGVSLPPLPSCRPSQLGLGFALEPAIGSVVVNTRITNNAAPCRLRGNLSIHVLDAAGPDAVPVFADLDRELTVTAFAWENWCGAPGKFTLRLTLGAVSTSSTIDPPTCGDPRSGSGLRSTQGASALQPLRSDRTITTPASR